LRKIHNGIEEGSERDIPPEIWSCLESRYMSNAPASGNEKQTSEQPPPVMKPK